MDIQLYREGPDYVVAHPDGVVLRFRRLKESHEDVTGLVRISLLSFLGRGDGDLFDGKLILTGPRSKADAVKACKDRVPEFTDWYALIERACQSVRHALEEGTPIVDLSTEELSADEPFVLDPILRLHENALVYGDGGAGKSTLALWWAMQIPGKVLYLDYEDEAANMARRLHELSKGHPPHVYYKRAEFSLPTMEDGLARQIAQEHIDGLMIDSAGLACGLEPEKADSANAYFRSLRLMSVKWTLTIAHQPKSRQRDPLPFGSVYWWNNPRRIWQVRRDQDEGADEIRLGLWHRKANNGKLEKPLGYRVQFTAGVTTVESTEVRRVESFRTSLSQTDQVTAALEDAAGKPLGYPELAAITGIGNQNIYKVVQRSKRAAKAPGGGFVLDEYA